MSAVSPEGNKASMPLADWLAKVSPPLINCGEHILPDGIKAITTRGAWTIAVYEASPRVLNLKWITENSQSPYGTGATYRNVRIAVPYMLLLASFIRHNQYPSGIRLSGHNECYFRTEPLAKWNEKLCYPSMLNVSKFPGGKPLTWICTQHVDFSPLLASKQPIVDGIKTLIQCMIGTGFNLSSESHEGNSWFTACKDVDERISTVKNWEKATTNDPLFVLDVPWKPTGFSLTQVVDKMFNHLGEGAPAKPTAATIARHIFTKTA